MAREKKDGRPITINMRRDVYELLAEYCRDTGLEKTTAIERILLHYFEAYNEDRKSCNRK